jgi:hypothetical protein
MATPPRKLPSIAVLVNRCLPFHRRILVALAAGNFIVDPSWSAGEHRGLQTARKTLARWGCVDATDKLTDHGAALLVALETK